MKFLSLLWGDLVLYCRKNRLIFFLYCFGGVLSAVAVLYFYGNMVPIVYNRNSTERYYREYRLISDGAPLSMDELQALSEEEKIEGVCAAAEGEIRRKEEDGNLSVFMIPVASDLHGDPPVTVSYGSASFGDAPAYSVIVPYGAALRVGDVWDFMGKEFHVIGVHGDDLYYIPLAVFEELELSVDTARVYAAKKADVDNGSVRALLEEKFPGAAVRDPFYGKIDRLPSQRNLLLIGTVYAFGILSFLLLFVYLMEESARESAVCRILGATAGKLLFLRFCEVLLLSTLSSLAGIVLHAALYTPVFSKWNVNPNTVFSAGDYLLVLAGTVVLTMAVAAPFLLRVVRRTPKDALLSADR